MGLPLRYCNHLWAGLRLLRYCCCCGSCRYCCCCCSCRLGLRRCIGCCWNLRLWRHCQLLCSMLSLLSPGDRTYSNHLWAGLRLLRYCCCCGSCRYCCCCCCSCRLGLRRCIGCCWNLRLWRRCQLLCSMLSFSSPGDTTYSNHLWVGLRLLR